jgi:hypothetical protein
VNEWRRDERRRCLLKPPVFGDEVVGSGEAVSFLLGRLRGRLSLPNRGQ